MEGGREGGGGAKQPREEIVQSFRDSNALQEVLCKYPSQSQ